MARASTLATDLRERYTTTGVPARWPFVDAETGFLRLSGTSMATAVTSGAVALMVDARRRASFAGGGGLSPNAAKALLQYTAFDIPGADLLTQGAGALNAKGAATLAALVDPSVTPGSYWLAAPTAPATVIGSESAAWARRIIWSDGLLCGEMMMTNEPAWSQGPV